MTRNRWMVGICGVLWAGCAAEVGSSTAALSGPDDCRVEDRCEGLGPATPPERPFVMPRLAEVPRFEGEMIPVETSEAYGERTGAWITGANGFAARHDALAGFPTFVPGSDEGSHGAVMLWSTAIAWQEQPSSSLFPERLDDVAQQLVHAQAYARARGYEAGLPYFERQEGAEGPVDSIAILSPSATEVVFVDLRELGTRDLRDVARVFAGADRYAVEHGYLGAVPTFELLRDEEREAIGLILFSPEHGYRVDLPEAELSPFCGRWDMPWCGTEPFCIGGTWGHEDICVPTEPSCGGLGQPCCGGFCEAGTLCTFNGVSTSRNCERPDDGLAFCGDGTCAAHEKCECDKDCSPAPECVIATLCYPDVYVVYCVECQGEAPRNTLYMACEEPVFTEGCTGTFGICR